MLPKPEKTKKINNLLDKTDTNPENDAESALKKIQSKRRLVLISLILTAGLSLFFWVFRSVQQIIDSPPSINLDFKINFPKINFKTSSSKTNLSDSKIRQFLASKNWSVNVAFKSNPAVLVFQSTPSPNSLTEIISELSQIKPSNQSLINLNLPQGLSFQEKIITKDNLIYQNLISIPGDQIIILINTNGINNLESIKSDLSTLVDSLYWFSVSSLN